jgi:hypothetical protein
MGSAAGMIFAEEERPDIIGVLILTSILTRMACRPREAVNSLHLQVSCEVGGRGGIRTPVRIAPKPDFESGAFNHSATLPAETR